MNENVSTETSRLGCLLCGEDYNKDSSWSSVSDDCDGKSYKSLLQEASGRKDLSVISDDSDLCPECCGRLREYGSTLSRLEDLRTELKTNLFERHPTLAEREALPVKERRARVVVTEDLKTMMIRARLLTGNDTGTESLPKRARCDVPDTPGKDYPSLIPVSSCVFQDLKNFGRAALGARNCVSSTELNNATGTEKLMKPRHTSVAAIGCGANGNKTPGNRDGNAVCGPSGSGGERVPDWLAIRAGDRTIKRLKSKKRATILGDGPGIWVKRRDL